MKRREPSLLRGIVLCLWDAEAVRLQTSRWKRSLLIFISGGCLEVAVVPYLTLWLGYQVASPVWFFSALFIPLGLFGLYAGKFGDDRLVEWLLVMPDL